MASLLTGYGYGYGDGYGGGGYGGGYGCGSGGGYGDGDGLPPIAGYEVTTYQPFGFFTVGCETHSVSEWRAQWAEIADANDVLPSDALGEAIEAACVAAETE